jgi:hypothetical protein
MGGVRVVERGSDGALIALFESPYRLNRLAGEHPEWMLERMLSGV